MALVQSGQNHGPQRKLHSTAASCSDLQHSRCADRAGRGGSRARMRRSRQNLRLALELLHSSSASAFHSGVAAVLLSQFARLGPSWPSWKLLEVLALAQHQGFEARSAPGRVIPAGWDLESHGRSASLSLQGGEGLRQATPAASLKNETSMGQLSGQTKSRKPELSGNGWETPWPQAWGPCIRTPTQFGGAAVCSGLGWLGTCSMLPIAVLCAWKRSTRPSCRGSSGCRV